MSVEQQPQPKAPSWVERAKNLILAPTAEWEKIAAEKTSVRALYVGWIAPVVAIPFVAGAVGRIVYGYGAASFRVDVSPLTVITESALQYVFALGAIYVIALTIDGLATYFDGRRDRLQALKVAAYSPTALAVTGVFALLPGLLAWLTVLGLYSVFTFYRGLPILMRAPEEKAMAYAASVVAAAVLLLILATILTQCARLGLS